MLGMVRIYQPTWETELIDDRFITRLKGNPQLC